MWEPYSTESEAYSVCLVRYTAQILNRITVPTQQQFMVQLPNLKLKITFHFSCNLRLPTIKFLKLNWNLSSITPAFIIRNKYILL